jgi:hypothetical protein
MNTDMSELVQRFNCAVNEEPAHKLRGGKPHFDPPKDYPGNVGFPTKKSSERGVQELLLPD